MDNKPQPPAAPDIGGSTKEGIEAYVQNLPEIIKTQAQYQPELTGAGIEAGREQYFAAQEALAEGMSRYGDDVMDQVMTMERKFGPELAKQYVQNMRAAAPGYFGVRDAYEGMLQDDLALGNTLSDEQSRMVQQATRVGQGARGNILGTAPTAQETMRTFLAGEGLRDKRMGRAAGYAASAAPGVTKGTTPSVMGAYRGQAMPSFSSAQMSPGQGMAVGQQGASMAQSQYGKAYGNYQSEMANYQSPWATVAGLGMSGVGMAGGLGWQPFG
jgi:hypothetical protein